VNAEVEKVLKQRKARASAAYTVELWASKLLDGLVPTPFSWEASIFIHRRKLAFWP